MEKINAYFYYSPERGCGALSLIKIIDNKRYRIDVDKIPWVETSIGYIVEPIPVNEFTDARREGEKGNLYGENLALKEEVKFLREQVAKLLEKY